MDAVEYEEWKYLASVYFMYHVEWKWTLVDNSNIS